MTETYVENKAGLTGQTVPGRRIPGHWPYPGPEELAEAELVGPDAWTFLSFNYTRTGVVCENMQGLGANCES